MLLVSTRSNLISPRPSELTHGQFLIDISCHLICPHFSFALSSHLGCLHVLDRVLSKFGHQTELSLSHIVN